MKKAVRTIEEELPHMRFLGEAHKCLVNLWFTYSHFHSAQLAIFRPFDLTPQQFNILLVLYWASPERLSVLDIKERMVDSMSNVSRLVEKLKEKGFVDREAHPDDRRMVQVGITEAGVGMVGKIFPALQSLDLSEMVLDESEAVELNSLLNKLRAMIVVHGGQLCRVINNR